MKTVPSGLVDCGTLVFGIRIVRRDATVFGFTEHDVDQTVTVDGHATVLAAAPGFSVQGLVSAAGLGVDNTEIQVIADDAVLTRADILARKWDGARVYVFRYNWKSPGDGILPVKRGGFGNFTPQQGQFKVEFRDLRQALQQDSTWVIQETCRWRLGDLRCGVDLTPYTTVGEVASVTSAYEFAITGSDIETETDHYGEGSLTWLTGSNAGTPAAKIKSHEHGVIVLSEAAVFEIAEGDTFEIVAGCRKRWDADCRDKFDNILNFGGEKDKPTRDELASPPQEVSA